MGNLAIERSWLDRGATMIAGADEVGRGAWAGPVVAGVVAVSPQLYASLPRELNGIDDSKLLSAPQRARLAPSIKAHAAAWGLGAVTSREIADAGLSAAVRLAIQRAFADLSARLPRLPDILLTDAVRLPGAPVPVASYAKADRQCLAVAMASILAKVHRDRLMRRFDPVYPWYDLAQNKGYGTRSHQEALLRFGPCAIHRASFRPVMRAASLLLNPTRENSAPAAVSAAPADSTERARNRVNAAAICTTASPPAHQWRGAQ